MFIDLLLQFLLLIYLWAPVIFFILQSSFLLYLGHINQPFLIYFLNSGNLASNQLLFILQIEHNIHQALFQLVSCLNLWTESSELVFLYVNTLYQMADQEAQELNLSALHFLWLCFLKKFLFLNFLCPNHQYSVQFFNLKALLIYFQKPWSFK